MMKRERRQTGESIRRATVLAACLLFGTSEAVSQQVRSASPSSAQIGVEVQVGQSLAMIGTNDLRFGQIAATNSSSVRRIRRDDPDAGRFEVRGSGNHGIRVTYVAPTQLTNESGAGTIGIDLELYGSQRQSNASSAERLLQNEAVSLSAGRYYFFVGGELSVGPLSSNPPGLYTGEFELEVSYLDL